MQKNETWNDYQTRKIRWLKLIIKGQVVIIALWMIALGIAIWKYAEVESQKNEAEKNATFWQKKAEPFEVAEGK